MNLKMSARIEVYYLISSSMSDDELPVLPTDRTHEQAVKSLLSHSNERRGGRLPELVLSPLRPLAR